MTPRPTTGSGGEFSPMRAYATALAVIVIGGTACLTFYGFAAMVAWDWRWFEPPLERPSQGAIAEIARLIWAVITFGTPVIFLMFPNVSDVT